MGTIPRFAIVCASMRPRFMNRGSDMQATTDLAALFGFNEAPIHESGKCHRLGKRSGHWQCFNEAPIHESGKLGRADTPAPSVRPASMRPRFMNRGSESRSSAALQYVKASMRPRFMNRGSRSHEGHQSVRQVASMRPRFMNRGSPLGPSAGGALVSLQ